MRLPTSSAKVPPNSYNPYGQADCESQADRGPDQVINADSRQYSTGTTRFVLMVIPAMVREWPCSFYSGFQYGGLYS